MGMISYLYTTAANDSFSPTLYPAPLYITLNMQHMWSCGVAQVPVDIMNHDTWLNLVLSGIEGCIVTQIMG